MEEFAVLDFQLFAEKGPDVAGDTRILFRRENLRPVGQVLREGNGDVFHR